MSRTSDMIESQERNREEHSIVGRTVTITPVSGTPFSGVFIGKRRLPELNDRRYIAIDIGDGIVNYINSDNVSYIAVMECGYVAEEPK
jgi:hypothetical protein